MSLIKKDGLAFKILNGEVYCNSTQIAKEFEKAPSFVMRKIRLEIKRGYLIGNVVLSSYVNLRGKTIPRFDLTKEGYEYLRIKFSCPKNKSSDLLYLLTDSRAYKIGVTQQGSLDKRVKVLQTGNPYKIEIIASFKIEDAKKIESKLHEMFKDKRLMGEWFNLDDEDIKMVKGLI